MNLKANLKTISALLVIVLALVGCGAIGGHEEEQEQMAPISATDWPTAQPTSLPPTPTPFPKVTLAPKATPTPRTDPAPAEEAAVSIDDLNAPTDLNALIEQVSAAGGGLSPVAAGLVRADSVPLRQGPDDSYGVAGTANRNDLLAVFGTDPSGNWLYVLTVSLLRGWLPADAVRVTGSLEDAPVLPANPLPQQAAASTPAADASSNSTPSSQGGAALAPADLEPVVTARVDNFALNMRQGPGAAYGQLDSLSQDDEVGILAFNLSKDWVLVKTADDRYGWVSLPLLTVNGSLEAVPVVISPTPDQPIPAGQIAPIRPSGPVPAESSAIPAGANRDQAQSSAGPAEVVPAAFNSTPAIGTLTPVATALIGRPEVNLQPAPGPEYAPFKTLTQDDERIAILGIDPGGGWVLVDPAWSDPGWIAKADLNVIEGTVANAPTVFTGWVESNGVEVRRGPGIYEDRIGSLSINTLVQVLGLNSGRSWALVKPMTADGLGWTPVRFLDIAGPLSSLPEAPQLPAAPEPAQAAAAPMLPAVPLAQTKLVFQTSSGGDIMVINGDGSGLRRLTAGIDPVLSPDGQTVAFTRWEGETGSLWTIGIDGSNEKSVLGSTKQAKGPAWSPDGARIVLNFQHGGMLEPNENCYELDGREPPRPPRNATDFKVKMGSDFDPALCWTLPPDPHWGLRVVNLADSNFEDVDGGTYAFRPTWDPSQPWRIVSDGGSGLVQVDVNDQANNRLLTDEVNDGSPVFSPDGRYLAVVTGNQGGSADYNIHRMNADGSGRIQLTKTPLWVTTLPDKQQAWNNVAPAWSPDGSQIAFLTDRTGRWEVWIMNADGSDQRPMFSDEVNNQLNIQYNFVDERVLSWR